MFDTHAAWMVAIMSAVTILLRFLPFCVFGGKQKTPEFVMYLGKVLPFSIMGMLVVYCLRNTDFTAASHGIPELLACALVAGLHIWKSNTLLSIIGGTAAYMVMVQLIW